MGYPSHYSLLLRVRPGRSLGLVVQHHVLEAYTEGSTHPAHEDRLLGETFGYLNQPTVSVTEKPRFPALDVGELHESLFETAPVCPEEPLRT